MVKLAITDFGGAGDAPILVMLHGLLGTARNLTAIARGLTSSRRVIGFDMRNHGQSPWANSHTYSDLAQDVEETLIDISGPYDLLGHSMGGKTAMIGVLEGRLAPRKLVIGDIAPVPYDHTQAPAIEAMVSTDLSSFDRRAPLARHLGQQLNDPVMGQFLAQAAELGANPSWAHNLDVLLAEMDAIVGFPNIDAVSHQDMLVIAGGASHYVDPQGFTTRFPKARFETIEGAGHWVHAEAPAEFNALVSQYLKA